MQSLVYVVECVQEHKRIMGLPLLRSLRLQRLGDPFKEYVSFTLNQANMEKTAMVNVSGVCVISTPLTCGETTTDTISCQKCNSDALVKVSG